MPEPSTIVNLFTPERIFAQAPEACDHADGFRYVVPEGKALLITDVIVEGNPLGGLWTDLRGIVYPSLFFGELQTPVVINTGETLCPSGGTGDSSTRPSFFVSRRLVDSP